MGPRAPAGLTGDVGVLTPGAPRRDGDTAGVAAGSACVPMARFGPPAGGRRACAAAALALPWMSSRTAWDRLLRPWRRAAGAFFKISPGDAQVDWGRGRDDRRWRWVRGEPASRARHELKLWIKAGRAGRKRLGTRSPAATTAIAPRS